MSEGRYWLRLLAVCFFGGGLLFYTVLNLTVRGGKVTLPDLKGLSKTAASRRLEGLGLKMAVREERFDSRTPYGVVLDQDIDPGTTLKSGRTVELTLSMGTKVASVPELRGTLSLRQATLLLDQNGLVQGVVDAISNTLPRDTVLAQSPEPGIEVPRGAAVSLLISSGPELKSWVMPDFKGDPVSKARSFLKAMGLVLRRVTEKKLPGVAPGTVASQSLSAGAKVEEGLEVALVVAEGAAELEAPRLAAIEYLVPEEGFVERRVRILVTDSQGERTVFNAMAKPGEAVRVEPRVRGKASYRVNLAGQLLEEVEIP